MSDEEREYLNEMIRSLNNRLIDALRERDEARVLYCMNLSPKDPFKVAEKWRWDCFDKRDKDCWDALDRVYRFDEECGL